MNKLTVIVCSLSLLTACGGTGDESAAPAPTNVAPTVADPVKAEPQGMASLVINNDFNLSTKFNLAIDVTLSRGDEKAYLNICQKKSNTERADYNNCLFRAPLTQGVLTTTLAMSRQDIALVAEIWFYDTSTQPLAFTWQFDTQTQNQIFEIR
ncbi:hypothetical protein P20311_0013 [Pseudoalteromonas sp. BSi20311]|jgi:hypothetical protein|uniref:hypothetical protein n=1 Tax=Pseudoalteromonas sp. BSi20311 TaxID=383911 RepID=UPI00023170E8|nr:hypothetical protein [Pseudoalteromonas sp. BSi20311]GAA62248.1 hypothetical protein P20311_0013 [Pseudoalteromonas sp. BSi20311]HCP97545.1 hypothetical protein [Pseudoalteromonas sp.]|tara:strand:- start:534 stop:992 length:459 start_codon:yes stop_codon:yes gene_type:complete